MGNGRTVLLKRRMVMSNDKKLARILQLETSVNKMIMDGTRDPHIVAEYLQRILDPSLPPVELAHRWTKARGTIRFSVVSDGWTGLEWIEYCYKNGHKLSTQERFILNSPNFKSTPAGVTVEIEILTGELFKDSERTNEGAYSKGVHRNLAKPNTDISCLIRKAFTNGQLADMELVAIIGMSEPIDSQNGVPTRLGFARHTNGFWLGLYDGDGGGWSREVGFAFEFPVAKPMT